MQKQILFFITFVIMSSAVWADNWPQWRGPRADGTSQEKGIPIRWGPTENIAWKAPLEGLGSSTPVVWEDSIFLTSQVGSGQSAGRDFQNATAVKNITGGTNIEFLVQAFHRLNGRLLWTYRLPVTKPLPAVHVKHNLASPSCITDGERVYAWFGTGHLVALEMGGKVAWKQNLGQDYHPFDIRWGHGSSPALHKDALILLCDHPPASYMLALDKHTGKRLWLVDRGKGKRSYTTPLVIPGRDGDQLIVNTTNKIEAFDPVTGKSLWAIGQPNRVPVPTPVYHDGVLYASRGYRSGPYLAVLTDTASHPSKPRLLWRVPTGAPYVSSLIYYDSLIYMATERGIMSCIEASTGKIVWRERLGGVFSASPVAADEKIYFTKENGQTLVIDAGRELKIVAQNETGERIVASPAISGGHLFLRTDDNLIRVGK